MLREVGPWESCPVCRHRVPCPFSPGTSARRQGPNPLCRLPLPEAGSTYPAGSARSCVRAPAPSRRAHALRASASAHFSQNGSAHARSTPVPLHSHAPPHPAPRRLYGLQTLRPASSPGVPSGPAFHPRPAGECLATRGRRRPCALPRPGRRAPAATGDKQRARSPGAALPARRPGIALPPPRARSSSKGGKKRRKK